MTSRGSAPACREDMVPRATVHGDYVVGLGANNPKGHAACVLAAVEAACRAGAPLRGALLAGFGSGGMPVDPRPGAARRDVGHGRGCAFMLERGFRGDFAVIAKTGWAVAWEEVGLAWLRVRVHGALNYAGIRHFVRYENPIVRAATVIGELERWFPEYTKANTSGLVAPQGSIGAIEGGWTHKPTFVPAACDLYIDLRLSPRTSVPDARRQFEAAIADIRRRHPEIPLTWELMVAVPGTHTDPGSWIVQSCMRGWEDVEGRPHAPRANQSGATDANILRAHGIPTARVGMARVPDDAPMPDDFSKGMNVVSLREMERLTRCLVYVIVDTCLRSRREIGLDGDERARGRIMMERKTRRRSGWWGLGLAVLLGARGGPRSAARRRPRPSSTARRPRRRTSRRSASTSRSRTATSSETAWTCR